MKKTLFIILQKIVPQHFVSRFVGKLANAQAPWFKNIFINWFIKKYQVDMTCAQKTHAFDFINFNDFFTRKLRAGTRPIDFSESSLVSPVDGKIYQCGKIENGRIFQAKGFHFSARSLLADSDLAQHFMQGDFATLYLAPKDYHRIHMPLSGRLVQMTYIPGKLFSVNETTSTKVEGLFARNERVVCVFETAVGKMVLVLVGAMIVGSIFTRWAGQVAPARGRKIVNTFYDKQKIFLNKGEEVGHFQLGSTVIILLPEGTAKFHALEQVKMGATLADLQLKTETKPELLETLN